MFAHLHTHSWYSFLEGLPSPAELAQAAAQAGLPASALTDVHSLTGAVQFQLACDSAGVQGILGLELFVELPLESQIIPPTRSRDGAQHTSNPTARCNSIQAQSATQFPAQNAATTQTRLGAAGARRPRLVRNLCSLASLAVPSPAQIPQAYPFPIWNGLAASHSSYYRHAEQAELQRLLCAIRLNKPLQTLSENEVAPPNAGFPTPAEMAQRYQAYPQALRTTLQIAERCRYHLPLGQAHFPKPPLEPGETPDEALRKKAYEGAQARYGQITPTIRQRLEHELQVIAQCEYAALFLIVQEIIAFVSRSNIPFSSRGPGSLILGGALSGYHKSRPAALEPVFRALSQPGTCHPTRYRY